MEPPRRSLYGGSKTIWRIAKWERPVLFGAGAEVAYGLKEGASFIKPLLTSSCSKERTTLLGKKKKNFRLIHNNCKVLYLQTITYNAETAKKVLGKTIVNKAIEAYEKEDYSKCEKVIRFREWYNIITTKNVDKLSARDKKQYKFFLENAVFFDVLDGKFNDLRTLPLHSNGYRVINAYVTIFISMLKGLYNVNDDFKWTWENVLDLLLKPYDTVDLSRRTYYSILNDIFGENGKEQYEVITTNYTSIAEKIFEEGNVVYLHGRLNWFEDYNELRIYDACNPQERKIILEKQNNIVPFILIPSGVKPLICTRQIEEFSKFISALNESKFLCVTGYKFNSEDNHINSIIAEWLAKKNGKLVFLNFEKSVMWEDVKWAQNISMVDIGVENLDILLTSKASILNININRDDSYDVFQRVTDLLKNAERKK